MVLRQFTITCRSERQVLTVMPKEPNTALRVIRAIGWRIEDPGCPTVRRLVIIQYAMDCRFQSETVSLWSSYRRSVSSNKEDNRITYPPSIRPASARNRSGNSSDQLSIGTKKEMLSAKRACETERGYETCWLTTRRVAVRTLRTCRIAPSAELPSAETGRSIPVSP